MSSVRSGILGAFIGGALVVAGVVSYQYFQASKVAADPSDAVLETQMPGASPMVDPLTRSVPAVAVAPLPINAPAAADPSVQSRQNAIEAARLEKLWIADTTGASDPALAVQTENGLIEKVSSAGVKQVREQPAKLEDIACRQSMCRIESTFAPGTSGGEWATHVLMEMGATFGTSNIVSSPTKDGGSTLVIYAFRLGVDPKR